MTEYNDNAKALTDGQLKKISIPDFERSFIKTQAKGERKFTASGAKADLILKYVLKGGFTRDQIAHFTDASASRVGEVVWCLENAEIDFPTFPRKSAKKDNAGGNAKAGAKLAEKVLGA